VLAGGNGGRAAGVGRLRGRKMFYLLGMGVKESHYYIHSKKREMIGMFSNVYSMHTTPA
jgi:hypothetical protein